MTRKIRSRANLENKITDLYIRLTRRTTQKISRTVGLRKRLEFYRNILNQQLVAEHEIVQANTESAQTNPAVIDPSATPSAEPSKE